MATIKEEVCEFLDALSFRMEGAGAEVIARRRTLGVTIGYLLRFEDPRSFAQTPAMETYAGGLLKSAAAAEGARPWVVVHEEVKATRRFEDFRSFAQGKGICAGSVRDFLSEFVPTLPTGGRRSSSYVAQYVSTSDGLRVEALPFLTQTLTRNDGPRLFVVHAPAGFGKTQLAERLAQTLDERKARDASSPTPFLVRFADHRLIRDVDDLLDRALDNSDLSVEAFKILLRRGRVWLILDGFDELAESAGEQVSAENITKLASFIRRDSEGRVVLTVRSTYLETSRRLLGPMLGEAALAEICALDVDAQREFLSKNSPVSIDAGDVASHRDRVLTFTAQNEYVADLARSPLNLKLISEAVAQNRSRLPKNLSDVYESFLESIFQRERERQQHGLGDAAQWRFLEAVAGNMLSDSVYAYDPELLEMLVEESCREEIGSSEHSAERLRELCAKLVDHAVFNASRTGSETTVQFLHESVRDYCAARGLLSVWSGADWEVELASNAFARREVSEGVLQFLASSLDAEGTAKLIEAAARHSGGQLGRNIVRLALADEYGEGVKRFFPSLNLNAQDLHGLVMEDASLDGLAFGRSNLSGASFRGCDLPGADFRYAILRDTEFERSSLSGARFPSSIETNLVIDGERLSGTKALSRLVMLGAVTGESTARMSSPKITTGEDLVKHVLGKFYRGTSARSAVRIDRYADILDRGKAGSERSLIRNHVLPTLKRYGYVSTRQRGTRDLASISPAKNGEVIEFLYAGKSTPGLREIMSSVA